MIGQGKGFCVLCLQDLSLELKDLISKLLGVSGCQLSALGAGSWSQAVGNGLPILALGNGELWKDFAPNCDTTILSATERHFAYTILFPLLRSNPHSFL